MTAVEDRGRHGNPWRFCLAPMMQKTDRHFRYLVRLLSPHIRLYTEMITTGAILFGDRARFLEFAAEEKPVALQLGGGVASELARAALIAAEWGYDEINLNCGCPSDRVQSGAFGACLMRDPFRVATCISAMRDVLPDKLVVSVKTRLGVDELYSYDYFNDFVGTLVNAGCRVFHIHARKAWLSGLSPQENRDIPPLEYAWVYRLKRDFPDITVIANGGINSVSQAQIHLEHVDGVMLGRQAYQDPYGLLAFDQALFGVSAPLATRSEIIERYLHYVAAQLGQGTYLKHMSRHLLSFFQGQPGARGWRRYLSTEGVAIDAGTEVIESALASVRGTARQSGREFANPAAGTAG